MPFFSVIIPSKNRAVYLEQAVQSVFSQSFADFELIVVDNCSEDNTSELLSALRDPRLIVFRQEQPVTMLRNFETGLLRSSGQYVALLGDDDWWHEDFLWMAAQILQAKRFVDVLFFDHWIADAEGRVLVGESLATSKAFGRDTLPYGVVEDFLYTTVVKQPISMNSAVYRRTTISSLPVWFDDAAGSALDYPLHAQAALSGAVAFYMPARLGYYRVHSGSFTQSRDRTKAQQFLASQTYVCDQLLMHPLPDPVRLFVEKKRLMCLRGLARSYLLSEEVEKASDLYTTLKKAGVADIRFESFVASFLRRIQIFPQMYQGLLRLMAIVVARRSWWLTRQASARRLSLGTDNPALLDERGGMT